MTFDPIRNAWFPESFDTFGYFVLPLAHKPAAFPGFCSGLLVMTPRHHGDRLKTDIFESDLRPTS